LPISESRVKTISDSTLEIARQIDIAGGRSRLIVIGDRIFTDVLIGNHPALSPDSPYFTSSPSTIRDFNLSVLTTQIWAPETAGITLIRKFENFLCGFVSKREDETNKEIRKEMMRKFTKSKELVVKDSGVLEKKKALRSGGEMIWEGRS